MKARSRLKRRAYLLIETAMAGLLVALAMAMTLTLLTWTLSERRISERRGWATQEAANLMERLTALPFDRLDSSTARTEATLSAGASSVLPAAKFEAEIHDEPPLKRIDVTLSWKGASGRLEAPMRLTSWVARKEASR